jgi:hypothetical protein
LLLEATAAAAVAHGSVFNIGCCCCHRRTAAVEGVAQVGEAELPQMS